MAPLIGGEYVPRNLRIAMAVTRLANAEWARRGNLGFRYTADINIHEAIDPDEVIWIKDHVAEGSLSAAALLELLPEYERELVIRS